MNEKVVRLINILQDRFQIPDRTDGNNILMTFADIERSVDEIWQKSENWSVENLWDALAEIGVPNFTNTNRQQIFILVRI